MTTYEDQVRIDPVDERAAMPAQPERPAGREHSQTASVAPRDEPGTSDPTEPDGEAVPSSENQGATHESATEQVLFADAELGDLRARWAGVQAAFVDDPKDCVQRADVLVSDLVEQVTSGFARARSRLEEQWARGQEASTEDLRLALMQYRQFFERLLAV